MVARILEEEGLATVIVMTFKEAAEAMRSPRSLYVRFPIGLTLGAPGAVAQQRVVIQDALDVLAESEEPGSLRVLPYRWQRMNYEQLLKDRERIAERTEGVMTDRNARTDTPSPALAAELPLDEASLLHPGEWILLRVTRVDDEGAITHGVVIHHHRQRGRISKALRRLREQDPEAPVYIFVGGERRVTGEELRLALEEAANRDYVNARW